MTRRKRMILFFMIQGVFVMGANFAHPITPAFFLDLGLPDYMFGAALGSMLVVNFCMSPFWGKMIDYISSKTAILIGSLGYALGQFLFMSSRTQAEVIASRMFTGIFTSAAFLALLTYIVNSFDDEKERGQYLTISATIMSVCSAFGFLIGGLLGEISIGTAFGAQVVTILVCGTLFFIVCKPDQKVSIKDAKIKDVAKASNPLAAFLASRHFMNFVLLALFLVVISLSIGHTAFDQSFNYALRERFNFSPGYNGMIRGVMGITTLLVNSTITLWIIRRTDMRKSLIWVFAAGSVMMFIAIVTLSYPAPFIAANIIVFACASMSMPLIQNMVAKVAAGRNSNLIMGFSESMRSLGGIIGAFLAGFLYDVMPIYPFILGLLAFICACLFAIVYYKKNRAIQIEE